MFNILTFKCQAIKQAQVQYKMSNWITWFLSAILLNNVKLNSSKNIWFKIFFPGWAFLELPGHVGVDEGDLGGGVDGHVLDKLPVGEVARQLPQLVEHILFPGTFGLVWTEVGLIIGHY